MMNIRIVLVETSHPGNIGATARAMKTMGLSELVLVNPKYFPHEEATARASGAQDILDNARVFESLDDAIADCRLVAGLSARARTLSNPEMWPRQAAAEIHAVAPQAPVALVFGRERSGLSNAELDLCRILIHIPANPEYASLNLAAAVQVMCYELRLAAEAVKPESTGERALATQADMEHFFRHLEQVLIHTGFLDPDNPRHLMRKLRLLLARTQVYDNEVQILRGILTSIHKPE